MNFKLLKCLFIVFLGGVLSFCTYTPEEDFYKKIDKPDPRNYTISLGSHDHMDTIFLEGPAHFNYDIGSGNGNVQEVRIILNNGVIKTSPEPSGSFDVSLQTGIYQLKIEFVSTSGSGSLADQAGGELVEVWRAWILKVELPYVETPPTPPQFNTSIVDGYSVLTWDPYTRTRFVHYRIEIQDVSNHYITDPTITTWVDSTYTGSNNRTYRVYTVNEVASSGSEVKQLGGNSNLSINASFNLTDSTIHVDVPKPVFYGTFKSYSVSEDGIEIGQITDPNQTTFTFKSNRVGINYTSTVSVVFNPKPPAITSVFGNKSLNTSVPTMKLSRAIQKVSFSHELNSIFGFWSSGNDGKLFSIEPSTFDITDSVEIFNGPGYHIPYDGVFAYYSNPNAVPKQLTQLNLITHEEKSINAITSTFGSGPSSITASQSQIVSYAWFGPGSGNSIIYYNRVYNMATDEVLSAVDRLNSQTTYTISDDGALIRTVDDQIFNITNGSLSLVGTLLATGTWVGFRKDFCEEILTQSGNRVYIYDATSLALKRMMSVSTPDAVFVTYDVVTKCLIFNNTSVKRLYSVNIDTGNVKEFNVNASGFSFINGTIILNSKDYLKLY